MEWQVDGYWKINNNSDEYIGRLYVNQDNGIIYLTIYYQGNKLVPSMLELPLEIKFINGRTSTGARLTLLDCNRHKTSTNIGSRSEFSYTAKFLINGWSFEKIEDIVFSQVYFQLSNIIKWGSISKFDFDFVEGHDFVMKSCFIEPERIYSDDEIEISYVLDSGGLNMDSLIEKVEFEQIPQIAIKSTTNKAIDFFLDRLETIKRLIEIAIGGKTVIVSVWANSPAIVESFDDTIQRTIEIFHSNPKESISTRNSWHEYLFFLPDLINYASIDRWLEKYELLEPVVELYIEDLRSKDLSINRRFLNIVQALETYHSRIVCNGDASLKRYKERVCKILHNADPAHEESFLQGCSRQISLVARMYDLLIANFDIWFDTGNINRNEFAGLVTDTRHYFTHYNFNEKDKALSGEELYVAYEVLKYMLNYYILNELGFDREFVHKKVGEMQSRLATSLQLRKLDKDKASGTIYQSQEIEGAE